MLRIKIKWDGTQPPSNIDEIEDGIAYILTLMGVHADIDGFNEMRTPVEIPFETTIYADYGLEPLRRKGGRMPVFEFTYRVAKADIDTQKLRRYPVKTLTVEAKDEAQATEKFHLMVAKWKYQKLFIVSVVKLLD